MQRWTRRGVLASGLALAACALERPPLVKVYEAARPDTQPPLILIPGAFGSSLRDRRSGAEVWPVSDSHLLLGNYRRLELPIDPDTLEPVEDGIEAYAVFREGLGRDFYGNVIDALQRVGGYRRCGPGKAPAEGECGLYPFIYDFRRDNVSAARALDALIQRIRVDHGDPGLRVDIIAHSNGGLLARYYARYGTADLPEHGELLPTQAGARNIRRLLLVGTPNLGTLQPVLSLLRGEEIGLRNIPPDVMASCPGLTQLLPHPSVPWLVGLDGSVIRADLYDIATWRDCCWSLFDPRIAERTVAQHGGGAAGKRHLAILREYLARQLRRGRRFAEALGAGPEAIRPWVLGGDCELTLARLLVEGVHGQLHARERVTDIAAPVRGVDYDAAMFDPGDTVVTRPSLLGRASHGDGRSSGRESLRIAHAVFLCERHQQLMGNATIIDNVLHALFSGPDDA
ncbi:MAG TPA: hypothetical protein VFI92_05410 [Steroidobacteraceae bacterium]|nr:hypothetical protein [Steroidobacteraceae bacterium]